MKVVFAGPSIYPSATTRADYPSIVWRGPARQGDVAQAVQDGATAIGLIDGLYGTVAAVWHKEILYALSRGVRMIGGASLGALRAVECEAFGMRGVGAVFDGYRSGLLTDDGDVALLHAPAELDYAPLTETLVDFQATVARLERRLIDADTVRHLVYAAEQTFFWDRTVETVMDRARIDLERRGELANAYEAVRVRLKAHDALQVIDAVANAPEGVRCTSAWAPSMTRSFRAFRP